ncbi:hypothetical protein M3P19_00810 [Muricauda sp. 2012CJ35-5]|uniref:Virulence factor Evf domain-containing protein n=1 Tax=Flagellimonas spongiicola TaxID=2942208 RepID=A0ABT0PMA9_9FLAO|nr:hypothetical protein [Allomuricauda spongiicola]MCL6272525.1 hypothetical protein [Allomuricauda spongiicola]
MTTKEAVQEEHLQHIAKAENAMTIFAAEPSNAIVDTAGSENFTGSDGLFSMVFAGKNLFDDPKIQKKVDDARYYLQGFVSLVTNKLMKGQAEPSFNIPGTKILEIAQHLPLLAEFKSSQTSNHDETTTVAFSTKFLEIAVGMAIEDPTVLKKTQDFLTSLGDQIKVSHDVKATNYAFTMFSSAIEVIGEGDANTVIAKFKITSTSLNLKDVKTSIASCIKYEKFKLDFEADTFVAVFNLDALNNPAVKAKVDQLVTGNLVTQVEDSENYFNV